MRVEVSIREITRYEFLCPAPVYAKDVQDAIRSALHAGEHLDGVDLSYDDSIRVEPHDDGVLVWFEVSQ